jgi:hypothetical protein
MLRACIPVAVLLLLVEPASALEVKSCEDANVGLTELIAPVGKNSRTYKDDKVSLYVIDMVEPVCCAAELGANKCLAVVGVASVQLDEAASEDDAAKGLLITIPTRVFNEAADSAPGAPMKLRVNVEKGTLTLE